MSDTVEFIGCVACGRYERDEGGPEPTCCGLPMYGETIPVRPDNMQMLTLAYKRARKWARRAAGPREDAPPRNEEKP